MALWSVPERALDGTDRSRVTIGVDGSSVTRRRELVLEPRLTCCGDGQKGQMRKEDGPRRVEYHVKAVKVPRETNGRE